MIISCVHYTKYIPTPEKDIGKWVRNFEQQKSFKYKFELKTKSVYTEANGDCVIGRGENVRGVWDYSDSSITFEYVGLGDIEYSKKNGVWQESPRGEESDIFAQIKRFLTFDKFKYLGFHDGFLYQFKANIPFLAPGHWQDMIGLINISKKNFLPSSIWAGLPDSSVYWRASISGYNSIKAIKSPINSWHSYLVVMDSMFNKKNSSFKAIKKRLNIIEVAYQLKKTEPGIILTTPKEYNIEDIETMLAPGKVNVYGLTMNKQEAIKIGFLKDELNTPLFLTSKIFDQDNLKDAKIKFDSVSRPYILLVLTQKFSLPSEIALEIDGVIVAIARLDIPQKIDKITIYPDMAYYELEILRACLVQPLPIIDLKPIVEE